MDPSSRARLCSCEAENSTSLSLVSFPDPVPKILFPVLGVWSVNEITF